MLELMASVPGDKSFLYDLYADVRKDEVRSFGWNETQAQSFITMQFQMQQRSYRMQYPQADHRIVRREGQRIGRIMTAQLSQAIALIDISLLAACRNQGVGTQLLKSLQQEATLCGKPVQLKVMHNNPAKLLYERLGFQTTTTSEMYDVMQWHPSI